MRGVVLRENAARANSDVEVLSGHRKGYASSESTSLSKKDLY